MYRILIVDDEEIIRQGLTQIIDWTEIGFEVAGTARSGSSAVEFIHNESVDVVILDIKMPKMSGLEVSRYLYEHFPAIKIVILSGYAEFEYAQKTINYNVFSYLLKPSRKEVIQELFLKLKSIMDNERMESNLQSKGEYLEIKNLISSLLVQSGLQEGQSLTYAQNNWLETHRKKEDCNGLSGILLCAVSDCRALEHLKAGSMDDINALDSLNWEIVRTYGFDKEVFSFIDNKDRLCIFLQKAESEFPTFLEEIVKYLQEHSKKIGTRPVKFSLGKKVPALEDLHTSYKEADEILSGVFEADCSSLMTKEHAGHEEKAPLKIDLNKAAEEILRGLKNDSRDRIHSTLDTVISTVMNSGIKNRIIIHGYVNELLISIIEQTIEKQIKIIFPIKISNILGSLESIDTFECLSKFLHLLFDKTELTSNYDDNAIDNVLIKIAMDKINSDLGRPHSLDSISESLDITPSYLSKLFKDETGINFKDYLMSRRLKKAQLLLKGSQYKIHEISKMVGFQDSHYFSKVFKKQTGYYPSDYRMNKNS